jgi:thiamine biosynthesis protein ThiS
MHLIVNGKPREVDASAHGDGAMPLFALLEAFEVNAKLVAVAINGDVVSKHDFGAARVSEGDEIEIVRMVGGGAGTPVRLTPSPARGEGGS